MQELELYVHIPFCVQKCAYCDFLSAPADERTRGLYIEALEKEIRGYREAMQDYLVSTIFLGGGTPSILSEKEIAIIFKALRESFRISGDAEITIEANPGTVSEEKLGTWKKLGINRISFGLQSVNDRELKMLGRIHTFHEFEESYQMARAAGFENINVDLISAIPGQTPESWERTLRTVARLEPEHISAYSLIIEEGTKFYEWYGEESGSESAERKERMEPELPDGDAERKERMKPELPDEDAERCMYEATEVILSEYGFHRYEISNYAKTGYECRHNLGYWSRTQYLGIGLGASSLIGECRYHLVTDLAIYIERTEQQADLREEIEQLSENDRMEEFIFLGLRKTKGISKEEFRKEFKRTMQSEYKETMKKLEEYGLLEEEGDWVRLTRRGIDVSNYVFGEFLKNV